MRVKYKCIHWYVCACCIAGGQDSTVWPPLSLSLVLLAAGWVHGATGPSGVRARLQTHTGIPAALTERVRGENLIDKCMPCIHTLHGVSATEKSAFYTPHMTLIGTLFPFR